MTDTFLDLPAAATAWTYDASRDTLDFTTADGVLHGYSLTTHSYTLSLQVDGSADSIAVSPDGRYMLIGNHDQILTSAPTATEKTYVDDITRVDLTTHAVDHVTMPISSGWEFGIMDVAITSDGTALVTTQNLGGWTQLRSFDVSASTPQFTTVATPSQMTGQTWLLPTTTGDHVLVEEGNISDGPLHVYSTSAHALTADTDTYRLALTSAYQFGHGEINEAKGLIVDVLYSNLFALDMNLHTVADLSSLYAESGWVADATFTTDGKDLLLWEGAAKSVAIIDTTSWEQVGAIPLDRAMTVPGNQSDYGMVLASGGHTLALYDGAGSIELVNLDGQMPGPGQLLTSADGDHLVGQSGDDTLAAADSANYLRGGYGNDLISGGAGYDDVNGNQGQDTILGKSTAGDWLLGGQGNDSIDAHLSTGANILNGNLGDDRLLGGSGLDTLRGGQGDDVIVGGAGDNWLSGDRGSDTLTGGAGADTFHTSLSAGLDVVTDFSAAEGDKVLVDAGSIYTLSQSGPDTVIDFGAGNKMVLQHVVLNTLPSGWIVTV